MAERAPRNRMRGKVVGRTGFAVAATAALSSIGHRGYPGTGIEEAGPRTPDQNPRSSRDGAGLCGALSPRPPRWMIPAVPA